MKAERDARRRTIISSLVESRTVQGWVYMGPRPAVAARAECLRELTHDALDAGITRLILDQTDVEQARRDRATIREVIAKESADLEYFHVDASTYGGLQAADVIAWAYGAGGDWRRRLGPIVQRVRDLRT